MSHAVQSHRICLFFGFFSFHLFFSLALSRRQKPCDAFAIWIWLLVFRFQDTALESLYLLTILKEVSSKKAAWHWSITSELVFVCETIKNCNCFLVLVYNVRVGLNTTFSISFLWAPVCFCRSITGHNVWHNEIESWRSHQKRPNDTQGMAANKGLALTTVGDRRYWYIC